ncbi:MAG: T9SS type A sorting domain-containing protein [candidate division Zixibacteria bacterium]|nr:T9SS type A sorting domain-containing protein [candidate division Zixibacteria bacterium]
MKNIFIIFVGILLSNMSLTFAQEFTIEDFRKSEIQKKYRFYEKMKESIHSGDLLDQDDYNSVYARLEIDITDISGRTITGKVAMTIESEVDNLTTLDYNFHSDMTVDSVMINGQDVQYDHQSHILSIILDRVYNSGELVTTTVYYHGRPPSTGFGSFTWRTHGSGEPIISTMSCPEGARDWWPCKDLPHDKLDSVDVIMTVRDDLIATSNGNMMSVVDNGDGTKTYTWHISYPITTYLVCMTISNYQVFTDWYVNPESDSLPIVNYVFPEHYDDAVEDLSIIPEAVGIFASIYGDYPFMNEKYGHSIFPFSGGMEHQTNCSYGAALIRGDHYYDDIAVHELAHQWFGDMITVYDWPEVWMSEGFATYSEALYTEQVFGLEEYLHYMTHSNRVRDPSGPIYDPNDLWSGNTVYNKGSWVLHMLRSVMGDDAFFDGLFSYANNPIYMYGSTTTRQFQAEMEGFYEADLDWFFDQWVWGRNRPHYTYSWMSEDIGNGQYEVFLHIDQTQVSPAPELFVMPIKISPFINDSDTLITVRNDSREDDWRFILNGYPDSILIDKDDWILKQVYTEDYGLNIVVTELLDGEPGEYYSEVIEARGGITPYYFEIVEGTLPEGLELNNNTGSLSGTPGIEGNFVFTLQCTDSSEPQLVDNQEYTLVIGDPTSVAEEEERIPDGFVLMNNYPNPFNNSTVIRVNINKSDNVRINVFNILGQQVALLHDGNLMRGEHSFTFRGNHLSSGLYIYKLKIGNAYIARKMSLIK